MKSRILLFLVLISAYLSLSAQVNPGDAVVTRSSVSSTENVVQIFPVGITSTAHPGNDWGIGFSSFPNWNAQELGQVFGLAINTNSQHHLIYTSTSQVYPQVNTFAYLNGFTSYGYSPNLLGAPMAEGSVLIWELDPVTGASTPLVRSTTTFDLTTNTSKRIYNRGTNIGNICFDKLHNQIFATNMEDGMIYRIDADPTHTTTYGNVLSRYDPFLQFGDTITTGDSALFVKRGDRLWGIGYSTNKLYFARWNEDMGHPDPTRQNEIYSVNIDVASGDFVAAPTGLYNYADPGSHLQVRLPSMSNYPDDTTYSNPVSDIEFSIDGNIMMLAERTMSEAWENDPGPPYVGFAHRSRVFRYDRSGITWSGPSNLYYVGNSKYSHWEGENADGGVDLGYAYVDSTHQRDTCEAWVWTTGDALKNPSNYDFIHTPDNYVYGIGAIPVGGNHFYDGTGADPMAVNNSSLYQDIFSPTHYGDVTYQNTKALPGDIDVYRIPCQCRDSASISITKNPACVGDSVTLRLDGLGGWGRLIDDGGPGSIKPIPPGGRYEGTTLVPADIGVHVLCFVAFSANPDSTDDWCSDTACITVTVNNCCTKPDAFFTINGDSLDGDTICYGQPVPLYGRGGTWGKYYIDNGLDSSNIMEVPMAGRYDTLPPVLATVGTHTLCWVTFTANPDSTPNWCSDTMCLTFVIKQCCDSLHAYLDFPDSLCAGSVYLIKVSGGLYGQLILDDTTSLTDGIHPVSIFPPGGFPTDHIKDSLIGTTHKLCYVAYSDTTPGACTDTFCKYVKVVRCDCDSFDVAISSTPTGPMSYDFVNVGVEVPDFVQWSVDGAYQTQTNGIDPFSYTFPTGGIHIVCLHAGYLHPTTDGHAICCYKDRCDTIDIDRCDIWRATDSVTYTYDPSDYHTIHFTYTGLTPTSIIWDFGDGNIDYNSNSATVTHTFSDGFHRACAYVVWSLHDSANCCCLDTICTSVNINPCSVFTFDISTTPVVTGEYLFQITHTPGFITFGPVQWFVNTVMQPTTGIVLDYVVPADGIYSICADWNYSISTDSGSFPCHAKWCITDTLKAAGSPMGRFRAYPNPTSGNVIVEITNYGDGGKTAKVDVMDVTGQVVMTKTLSDIPKGISQNYMSIAQLPLGVYSLRMSMDDAHQISKLVRK